MTNTSTEYNFLSPVYFEITYLNPSNITIVNPDNGITGVGAQHNYSNLLGSDNILSPSEMSEYKQWIFHDPDAVPFNFFADAYAVVSQTTSQAMRENTISRLDPDKEKKPKKKHFVFTGFPETEELYIEKRDKDNDNGENDESISKGLTLSSQKISITDNSRTPESFALNANYPNPFNPETKIQYALPEASFVSLRVYNVLGKEVKTLCDGLKPAGLHTVKWDGKNANETDVPSGIYIYRMQAKSRNNSFSQIRKMTLLR